MPAPAHPAPWWHPQAHEGRRALLHARARLMGRIRGWFDARGFIEVDPNALQVSPGNETHIHALAADMTAPDGSARRLYLHTSPEFAMKKLLAAGEERLYALGHVWRGREGSPLHAGEFTMLEWYRAGEDYEAVMEDCCDLLRLALEVTGAAALTWKAKTCDPRLPAERLTVAEAFHRYAGIDLMATLDADGVAPDRDALVVQAEANDIRCARDDDWSDIFSRIIVDKVEPHLGHGRPTLLYEYPAPEAALARRKASDRRVSERFELYVAGVEMANGFGELTDAAEQRRRLEAEMEAKQAIYGERYPIDEDFIAALQHMPAASGVALGFDRLVLLATGASRIEQVIWTPLSSE